MELISFSAAVVIGASCSDSPGGALPIASPVGNAGSGAAGALNSGAGVGAGGNGTGGSPLAGAGESTGIGGVPLAGETAMGGALGSPAPTAAVDAGAGDAGPSGPPIIDLFNGQDLTGWTAYRETDQGVPGTLLSPEEAAQIFKPEDGTIRVYGDELNGSTQARHTLTTDLSYSKYIFWLEYRWGTKSFAPYADLQMYPRDAGILFHIHGDERVVWPSSIEFQIKEGTTGDIYALFARCTSLALNGGTLFVDTTDGGTNKVVNGANGFVQHRRSINAEVPDWNSLEMRVDGGSAVYLVNGQVVNRVVSIADRSGAVGEPITAGPIALQAEHAEAFYRNVRIQVLP